MSRYCSLVFLLSFFQAPLLPQPNIGAVVNGASFDGAVSPGCLISIFGTNLADSLIAADSLPLPTRLGSTSVQVEGVDVPLYFVAPNQINAQLPFNLAAGTIRVVVKNSAGQSLSSPINVTQTSPGIFTVMADGKGQPLLFDRQFRLKASVGPEDRTLILYAVGLGATSPSAVAGAPGASGEPLNRAVKTPEVYLGEQELIVDYAGLAPGFAGVYQVNVSIPSGTTFAGDRLRIRSGVAGSNATEVAVPATDVTGVTGTIDALFPGDSSEYGQMGKVSYSPMLVAGQFSLSVPIPTGGGSYSIAAVGEAGSALITITPDGKWQASVTVPTQPARMGDFSVSGFTVLDFGPGCNTNSCGMPMPGSIVPMSRFDPRAYQVMQLLPVSILPASDGATGIVQASGQVTPGSTFVIDKDNNSTLSRFGAFVTVPWPAPTTRSTSFKLYVNGHLIAEKQFTYPVISGS